MSELIQQSLAALEAVRAKTPHLPLNITSEYMSGKRLLSNGKTLMQCFESDATIEDRAKGTHIIQEYGKNYMANFANLIERNKVDGKLNIQAMQTSTDFPLWTTTGASVFQNLSDVDTGWVKAFRMAMFNEGKKYFEFGEADSNIEFYEMEEGQNYRGNDLTGEKYSIEAQKYGAVYNVTDETMMYNDFQANLDLTVFLLNAFNRKMQQIHYGVLADTAVANIANLVAYQTGTNTLEKDIKTINAAFDYLYNALRNKIPNAANAKFLMYVNGSDSFVSRIKQAFAATSPNLQTGFQVSGRPVEMIPTSNLATSAGVPVTSTRVEFVYPGRLLVRGVKRDLMTERYRDQTKDINVTKANFYVGAGCEDITQTVFADFA